MGHQQTFVLSSLIFS